MPKGNSNTLQVTLSVHRSKIHLLKSILAEALQKGVDITDITDFSSSLYNTITPETEELITKIIKRQLPFALTHLISNDKPVSKVLNAAARSDKHLNSSGNSSSINDDTNDMEDDRTENAPHQLKIINEELDKVKDKCCFYPNQYTQIKEILINYFDSGKYETSKKPFFVAKGNVKKLGVALGNINRRLSPTHLSYDYLRLCQSLFTCYSKINIDKKEFQKSNLYKYLKNKKLT